MKIIKTTSGNKISISRKEWEALGKKAGFSSTDGFDSVDKLVNRLKEEAGTQESTLADKWAIVAGNLQGILGGIISDVQSASEGYWHVSSAATELGIADNLKKINELEEQLKGGEIIKEDVDAEKECDDIFGGIIKDE